MASLWCRPVFCPWTLNLPIAIVLLRLRVHYSVEIKRYKSQIRIRIIDWSYEERERREERKEDG